MTAIRARPQRGVCAHAGFCFGASDARSARIVSPARHSPKRTVARIAKLNFILLFPAVVAPFFRARETGTGLG